MREEFLFLVQESVTRVAQGQFAGIRTAYYFQGSHHPLQSTLSLDMYRYRFTCAILVLFLALPFAEAFGQDAADLATAKTVILVRHAEKCTEPADNPGLTPLGQQRAEALVRTLSDVPVDAIYSTPLDRTRDTVRELASIKGVDIIEPPISSGFLERLAATIKASDDTHIVVSGHSNTTPRVVNLLAGTDYPDLDESEYDRLYMVHLGPGGGADVSILRYGPASGPPEDECS